jgi:hypothetical protein
MSRTIYLLSPANCAGQRGRMLFSERARFDLTQRLRRGSAPIGDIFTFLSGLYFRGKMAYATALAEPEDVRVITTDRGLIRADTPLTLMDLVKMASVDIDVDEPRYTRPLKRDARRIARSLTDGCRVVLLGSIATGKYVSPLLEVFGDRLHVPAEFAGRGDMSRGGLMLRHAERRQPMTYLPVTQAARHGARPPKLEPRRWTAVK